MNLSDIMKFKPAWDKFTRNHPKFPLFLDAAKRKGVKEGTVIGISIEDPDGTKLETNVKLSAEDLELFNTLIH